jgi:DNA-binding XRE family transcriptional regulator
MAKRKPKPPPGNSWRARLKKVRKELGLTQAQAADQAGVALRTWINWENEHQEPGRLALRLLKIAFPEHF